MTNLTPLSAAGYISLPTGMAFYKPSGDTKFIELGIVEPLEIAPETEETQVYDSRSGTRLLAREDVTATTLTLTMTLKMHTALNRSLSMAGALTYEDQSSVSAGTFTVTGVTAGGIYDVGKLDLSSLSADDGEGSPTAYVLNTNYEVDVEAGLVRIISIPGGAGANFELTYDAAAIATSAERLRTGIGTSPDNRGTFVFRSTNVVGPKSLIKLHDVQIRPSGGRGLVSPEEHGSIELTGRVFADQTQAAAEIYGFEATLT